MAGRRLQAYVTVDLAPIRFVAPPGRPSENHRAMLLVMALEAFRPAVSLKQPASPVHLRSAAACQAAIDRLLVVWRRFLTFGPTSVR